MGDDGRPRQESLEALSVAEWMEWLQSRTTASDYITGENLTGVGDPYSIFRDLAPRLTLGSQKRFVEALLQFMTDGIALVRRRPQGTERRGAAIGVALSAELFASLPSPPSGDTDRIAERASALAHILEDTSQVVFEVSVRGRLLGASLRALSRYAPDSIRTATLQKLLGEPATGLVALRLLMRREPRHGPEWFAEFVAHCAANGKMFLADAAVEELLLRSDKSLDVDYLKTLRQFLSDTAELLPTTFRLEFWRQPHVEQITGPSPTLQHLAATGVFVVGIEGTRGVDQSWSDDLLKELRERAEALIGGRLRFDPVDLPPSWYDRGRGAIGGTEFTKDTVFLPPSRREITVVPYGLVTQLCVVISATASEGVVPRLSGFATWRSVSDACQAGAELGTVYDTAASEELFSNLRELRLGKHVGGGSNPEVVAEMLIKEPAGQRVYVVDSYFVKGIEDLVNQDKSFANSERTLVVQIVTYRRPLFCGFPVDKSDLLWGLTVRDAVDKIVFGKHQFLRSPTVKAQLKRLGINALTPDLYSAHLEDAWVPVREELVPLSVLKPTEQVRASANVRLA